MSGRYLLGKSAKKEDEDEVMPKQSKRAQDAMRTAKLSLKKKSGRPKKSAKKSPKKPVARKAPPPKAKTPIKRGRRGRKWRGGSRGNTHIVVRERNYFILWLILYFLLGFMFKLIISSPIMQQQQLSNATHYNLLPHKHTIHVYIALLGLPRAYCALSL